MIAKKKRPAAKPGAEYLGLHARLCGKNKSIAPHDLSKPARGDHPPTAGNDDALLIAVAAENVAAGAELSEDDRRLVAEAASKIREVRKVAA